MAKTSVTFNQFGTLLHSSSTIGSGTIEILRPNASGTTTELSGSPLAGENYEKVDEIYSDGDSTYVYYIGGPKKDTYLIPNHSEGSGAINSVTVKVNAKYAEIPGGTGATTKCIVRTGNTDYESDAKNLSTSYTIYSESWTENPNTSASWTWDEIDAMEIGVSLTSTGAPPHTMRCTQVWVEIDFSETFAPIHSRFVYPIFLEKSMYKYYTGQNYYLDTINTFRIFDENTQYTSCYIEDVIDSEEILLWVNPPKQENGLKDIAIYRRNLDDDNFTRLNIDVTEPNSIFYYFNDFSKEDLSNLLLDNSYWKYTILIDDTFPYNSFKFNGTDYWFTGALTNNLTGDVTVELYFKFHGLYGGTGIVWMTDIDTPNGVTWQIDSEGGGRLSFISGPIGNMNHLMTPLGTFEEGKWYYVVVKRKNIDEKYIYVDGVLKASNSDGFGANNLDSLRLGHGTAGWEGEIQTIKVYNNGLKLYWDFREGSEEDGTIKDLSENDNDGTLTGGGEFIENEGLGCLEQIYSKIKWGFIEIDLNNTNVFDNIYGDNFDIGIFIDSEFKIDDTMPNDFSYIGHQVAEYFCTNANNPSVLKLLHYLKINDSYIIEHGLMERATFYEDLGNNKFGNSFVSSSIIFSQSVDSVNLGDNHFKLRSVFQNSDTNNAFFDLSFGYNNFKNFNYTFEKDYYVSSSYVDLEFSSGSKPGFFNHSLSSKIFNIKVGCGDRRTVGIEVWTNKNRANNESFGSYYFEPRDQNNDWYNIDLNLQTIYYNRQGLTVFYSSASYSGTKGVDYPNNYEIFKKDDMMLNFVYKNHFLLTPQSIKSGSYIYKPKFIQARGQQSESYINFYLDYYDDNNDHIIESSSLGNISIADINDTQINLKLFNLSNKTYIGWPIYIKIYLDDFKFWKDYRTDEEVNRNAEIYLSGNYFEEYLDKSRLTIRQLSDLYGSGWRLYPSESVENWLDTSFLTSGSDIKARITAETETFGSTSCLELKADKLDLLGKTGIQLQSFSSESRPTANEEHEGRLILYHEFDSGSYSLYDSLQVCLQNDLDSYSWNTILYNVYTANHTDSEYTDFNDHDDIAHTDFNDHNDITHQDHDDHTDTYTDTAHTDFDDHNDHDFHTDSYNDTTHTDFDNHSDFTDHHDGIIGS